MIDTKRVLCTAILTADVAFASSAMADSNNNSLPARPEAIQGRPLKNEGTTNPDPVSPGQEYKLNRETNPDAPPPGQGVDNWGKTKP
jgi:hypothetical protein